MTQWEDHDGRRAGGRDHGHGRPLAAKLKGLHALLTPGEQILLRTVLRRAAEREESSADIQGYAWAVSFNPFTYLDAIAVDLPGARCVSRCPPLADDGGLGR